MLNAGRDMKMIDERTSGRLSQIVSEWNRAERAIKLAEMNSGEIVLPAITELRYAGRRLVEFLDANLDGSEDFDGTAALLSDALFGIVRAKHDAIDTLVAKAGQDISSIVEAYGLEALPDLQSDIDTLKRVKWKIAKSRENRLQKSLLYDEILDEDLDHIFSISEKYAYMSPITNRDRTRRRKRSIPANLW